MQLTPKTLAILKNFASINKGIVIKPGNKLQTVSQSQSLLAVAEVDEEFEVQAPIYDLNMFLSVLDKTVPEAEFTDTKVVADTKFGTNVVVYCGPDLVTVPKSANPTAKLATLERVVKFDLKKEHLNALLSNATVMSLPDIVITVDKGNIVMRAVDRKNPNSNRSNIVLGEYDGKAEFEFWFNKENLNILEDTYSVGVAKEKVAHFASATQKLEYYIALEKDPSFYNA